jgi:hypothetical protein
LNSRIQELVRRDVWGKGDMEYWENLREVTLSHPTCGEEFENDPLVANNYVRLPKESLSYTYSQARDFSLVSVSFESCAPISSEVSACRARLNALAKASVVKEYFEQHGWPLEWKPGVFLLSPVLFQNIYLGALGEQAGKALLEAHLPITLEPITDGRAFEKFDFRVAETDAYIDFKYWSAPSSQTEDEALARIEEKMEAIGADKVAIINVLGESEAGLRPHVLNGGRVLTVPMLADSATGELSWDSLAAIKTWLERRPA